MVKQVTVTFEFDPADELVSNLKCFVDGVEKKKTTTRSTKKKEEIVMEDEAIITLDAAKLIFNNKAVADMELQYQDRVVIKYEKVKGSKLLIPTITKDDEAGNKLTKTNTIAYKGKQNTILAEFGTEFGIESLGGDTWKLVPKNAGKKAVVEVSKKDTYEDVIAKAEEIDLTIMTEDEENIEIDEMMFKI